jgi:AcrR family transcriptional regulator
MTSADDDESLRERKKRLTRHLIAGTAMRLFAEHGFDAVTVTQIAAAAGVAEKTVYNYFPRKTGLFFDEAGDILAELLFAVRNREPGQSALDAVQVFVSGRAEWAAGRRPARPSRRFRAVIAGSPALQAGMRDMFAGYESALAELLAAETGVPPGSAEPFIAAVALIAVIRAAFEAPASGQQPARGTAASALRLLRDGLGGYAVAGAPGSSAAAGRDARV